MTEKLRERSGNRVRSRLSGGQLSRQRIVTTPLASIRAAPWLIMLLKLCAAYFLLENQ
jgi:hypothetical protein